MSLKSGNNLSIVNMRDGMIDPAFSTPLYISSTSFSVAGDATGFIRAGRGVRLTFASSGEKVCLITSLSYSAGITTINVCGESLVNEVITKAEVVFSDAEATKNYVNNLNFNARYGVATDATERTTTDTSYAEETNCDCSIVVKNNDLVEVDLSGNWYFNVGADSVLTAYIYLKSGSAIAVLAGDYIKHTGVEQRHQSTRRVWRATADGTLHFTMKWIVNQATGKVAYRTILAKVIGKYT